MIAKGIRELNKLSTEGGRTIRATGVNRRTGENRTATRKLRFKDADSHRVVYSDARDLLLLHGYEKRLDEGLQAVFKDLIPVPPAVEQLRRSTLRNLASRQGQKRLKAAIELREEGRAVVTVHNTEKLKHPIVVEALIKAIDKEEVPEVLTELLFAVSLVHDRFLADQRIYPSIHPHLTSENEDVRCAAVSATRHCPNREKWTPIIDMLRVKQRKRMFEILLAQVLPSTPVSIKRKLQPVLVECWERNMSDPMRRKLHLAIMDTLDQRTIESFVDICPKSHSFKTACKRHIKMHCVGEEQEFPRDWLL
jgi:hypothetical protein